MTTKKPYRPHKVKRISAKPAIVAKIRRSKEKAYGSYGDWMKLRAAVIARDGGKCRKCGSTEHLQVDHIRPVAKGGLSVMRNLWTLCAYHHSLRPGHKQAKHLILKGTK
jgi:5-methylcytosine-specific restriction endonuclease McrA